MSVDYDAAWAAWDTPGHAGCTGFRYDPGTGTVQCADCRAVVAVPDVAEVADA